MQSESLMTAIVSGNNLGLTLSSFATLGQRSAIGSADSGRNGEQGFVNIANGNLVLQNRDDELIGHGLQLNSLRTYNSQGVVDGDNNDNWKLGFYKQVSSLTGTLNNSGSTVTRIDGDGASAIYTYSSTLLAYRTTDGDGAYDTLKFNTSTQKWTWTDGQTGVTELYNDVALNGGRINSSTDTNGNTIVSPSPWSQDENKSRRRIYPSRLKPGSIPQATAALQL